ALDGAILAKSSMQYGEDDVHIDGAICRAAGQPGGPRVGLEWSERRTLSLWFGGDDHGFAFGEKRRARSGLRVSSAELPGILAGCFPQQQELRIRRRQPAAFLGDTNRHNFIFVFIDSVENRGGGEQRDFVLAAASAKENTDANFFHAA